MPTPLELVATAFGLVCVWLTVKQNIWTWPTGIIMVTLYIVIFWRVRLYSDMGLQFVYLALNAYGWWAWLHGGAGHHELPVSTLTPTARGSWVIVATAGALLLGTAMKRWTPAALPYMDATATSMSLVAQWLQARKKLESWIVWIAVDVLSLYIYWVKNLHATMVLYAVFLLMCVQGFREWRRSVQDGKIILPPAPTPDPAGL